MDDGLEVGIEDLPDLVGTKQIAAMWCLHREFVTDVLTKKPDFPKPALNLSRKSRRWDRAEVNAWRRKHAGR